MANYGPEYQKAKQEKKESMADPRCEITKRDRVEHHHVVPKMFSGPDIPENLQRLASGFHAYLHEICNVKDSKLVGRRIHLSNYIKKNIKDDEKVKVAKAQLYELDDILIEEYVSNLVYKLGEEYRSIIFLTILNNFHTIRTLSIENAQLKAKLQ
jgi:hypothetical protein